MKRFFIIRSYQKDNILEPWMVLRIETDGPVSVARLDSFYFQSENREGTYLEWYDSSQNPEAGKPEREKLLKGSAATECAMATACVRWTTTPGRAAA